MSVAPTTRSRGSWSWILIPMPIGFIIPSLILFTLQVRKGGQSMSGAINDIASRQFAEGHNLFFLALWGLIPFLVLTLILLFKRAHSSPKRIACLCVFGMLGILAIMVPVHWEVWAPLYEGKHMSSTSVVAFIPLPVFCLITMWIGIVIGKVASRQPGLRSESA